MHPSRVWFVTGASSGFGRAICEAALVCGDSVVAAARLLDELVGHDGGSRWRSLGEATAIADA